MSEVLEAVPHVLVIEQWNQRKSNFVMDGAAQDYDNLSTNITAPNSRKLPNKCKLKEWYEEKVGGKTVKKFRLVDIRYIAGCPVIKVTEQEAGNYKPNPAYDTIWMRNGRFSVSNSGDMVGLYEFLKNHSGNIKNPNRPEAATKIFTEIDTNLDAKGLQKNYDTEFEIQRFMQKLKWKEAKGEYGYNHEVLSFLMSLFQLGPHEEHNAATSWVDIMEYATADPESFLASVASANAEVEEQVSRALAQGIINLEDGRATFTDSGKLICSYSTGLGSEEQKERVVDFMNNPKNALDLKQMTAALYAKKISLTELK